MIFLELYKEFCPDYDCESIKKYFSKSPYEGQDKIVNYLKHGTVDMVRMELHKDVITGENTGIKVVGMNDGEYTWFNTLIYYVEKYNLRLPEEFERKVLGL